MVLERRIWHVVAHVERARREIGPWVIGQRVGKACISIDKIVGASHIKLLLKNIIERK